MRMVRAAEHEFLIQTLPPHLVCYAHSRQYLFELLKAFLLKIDDRFIFYNIYLFVYYLLFLLRLLLRLSRR